MKVSELAFQRSFSVVVECLAQPWRMGEGLGLASTWYAKLWWFCMGGLTLSEDGGWGRGSGNSKREGGGNEVGM